MDKSHGPKEHHKHSDKNGADDVNAAHLAWDLWKSNDPKDWDKALDMKDHITRHNPKAWKKAMNEVDAEEEAQKQAKKQQHAERPHPRRRQQDDGGLEEIHIDSVDKLYVRPEQIQSKQPLPEAKRPEHPGYAPYNKFAPETPASPAYDAAYNRPKPEFYGVDLGIVKLGLNSDYSLEAGVNIGVAKTDVQVGLNNRVDAEFMPIGGPLHARAGAGIGVDREGLHSEVGAGANFFDVVNGDADFGARLGRDTGVDGDVRGKVFPVNVQADAGAGVGPDGVRAYAGADVNVLDQAGVHAGGHVALDKYNSGMSAGVGVQAGDNSLDFGPAIYSDGNTRFRPELHLDVSDEDRATYYPTGDRRRDSRQKQ